LNQRKLQQTNGEKQAIQHQFHHVPSSQKSIHKNAKGKELERPQERDTLSSNNFTAEGQGSDLQQPFKTSRIRHWSPFLVFAPKLHSLA